MRARRPRTQAVYHCMRAGRPCSEVGRRRRAGSLRTQVVYRGMRARRLRTRHAGETPAHPGGVSRYAGWKPAHPGGVSRYAGWKPAYPGGASLYAGETPAHPACGCDARVLRGGLRLCDPAHYIRRHAGRPVMSQRTFRAFFVGIRSVIGAIATRCIVWQIVVVHGAESSL